MAPMANAAAEKMEVDEPVASKKEEGKTPPKDIQLIAYENVKEQCTQLDKGEAHSLPRVLQVLHKTRKTLNHNILHRLVATLPSSLHKEQLLSQLMPATDPLPVIPTVAPAVAPMEVDSKTPAKSPRPVRRVTGVSVETELYLHLLCLINMIDNNCLNEALMAAEALIRRTDKLDKRSLDIITAKGVFYLAIVYERQNRLDELRSYLNARLRTATLRNLTESQATLIYTLLRCYFVGKHYPSAAKLVSKVKFPEGASNNDLARFLYYQARIKAMQLDYTAAAGFFMQAMRKAPQDSAIGFKQNAQKWVVVIGLLQGEIPERSVFRQPIYRKCLVPYLELTQAVRLGDLAKFNSVVSQYGQTVFEQDETLTLIVRLRQNVIKTALRQISLAYSRISIKDIAKKLLLNSEIDTEYLVSKAIADGALDASITSDGVNGERFMHSQETADVYRTTEPQTHFDSRIRYCLELHNQAVKALRFPPKGTCAVESIEEQREREQQELEYAKELAEEDDDDF